MKALKVLIADRSFEIDILKLTEVLGHSRIDFTTDLDDADRSDIVIVPCNQEHRISNTTHAQLNYLHLEIPVIGIENPDLSLAGGVEHTLDLTLPQDAPPSMIAHALFHIVQNSRQQKTMSRLQEDFSTRINEIGTLVNVGLDFASTLSAFELYDLIVSRAAQLIPAEYYALFIVSQDMNIGILRGQKGQKKDEKPLLPTRRLHQTLIHALRNCDGPIYDISPFSKHEIIRDEAIYLERIFTSMMIAPIVSKDRLIGFLELGNRQNILGFCKSDADHMEVLTDFAAVALENAYLYEKTQQLAQIDDLTRVQNFGFAQQYLEKLIHEHDIFSMLFIDLDGFKKINQNHGHLKGNAALQRVSEIFRNQLRAVDLASRFGGDEFVIVMPGRNLDASIEISQRIIDLIESERMFPDVALSASIGLAVYPDDGDTIDAIISAADTAMYQAKALGKGRIITYREMKHSTGDAG